MNFYFFFSWLFAHLLGIATTLDLTILYVRRERNKSSHIRLMSSSYIHDSWNQPGLRAFKRVAFFIFLSYAHY